MPSEDHVEPNSIDDFFNRFSELMQDAKAYGIDVVFILHYHDVMNSSAPCQSWSAGSPYAIIGLLEATKLRLVGDVNER